MLPSRSSRVLRPLAALLVSVIGVGPVRADGGPPPAVHVELRGGVGRYAMDGVDALIAESESLVPRRSALDVDRFGNDTYRAEFDGPIDRGAAFGVHVGVEWSTGWRAGGGFEVLSGESRTGAVGASGSGSFVADVTTWSVFGSVGRALPWTPGGFVFAPRVEVGVLVPRGSLELRIDGSTRERSFDDLGLTASLLLRIERRITERAAPFVEVGHRRVPVDGLAATAEEILADLESAELQPDLSGALFRAGLRFGLGS